MGKKFSIIVSFFCFFLQWYSVVSVSVFAQSATPTPTPTPIVCGTQICTANQICYQPPNNCTAQACTNYFPMPYCCTPPPACVYANPPCNLQLTPNTVMCENGSFTCGTSVCTQGQECYQPPTPTCAMGASCSQILPSAICRNTITPTVTSFPSITKSAPTATPVPTAIPTQADLIFKVSIPDLPQSVNLVSNVRVQLFTNSGSLVENKMVMLHRITGTTFFKTQSPVSFNITQTALTPFTLYIKQLKSTRRSFSVSLARGTTADCTTTACGSLANSDSAPLLMGDTDGFNDGLNGTSNSLSYGKVDATDLHVLQQQYGSTTFPPEPNADFNLDGKIDIVDVGILGKNYGKQ